MVQLVKSHLDEAFIGMKGCLPEQLEQPDELLGGLGAGVEGR